MNPKRTGQSFIPQTNLPPIKWRKRSLLTDKKKTPITIQWTFEILNCGYIITLVKWGGLVGASYCAPDDALPHWNPQKSIELAFARRKIRDDVTTIYSKSASVQDFAAIEYAVFFGSVPREVISEIRKNFSTVDIKL